MSHALPVGLESRSDSLHLLFYSTKTRVIFFIYLFPLVKRMGEVFLSQEMLFLLGGGQQTLTKEGTEALSVGAQQISSDCC